MFPVFYLFLMLMYLMQSILRIVHRYLNENILAVIMAALTVILAGL